MRMRRGLAASLLVAGVALSVASLPAVAQDEVRTEAPEFGGYTLGAEGAPAGVRFFAIGAIPTNPGQPEFEATTAHTSAVLNTGPQGRAVASSVWPGHAFGDGFSTVCQCEQSWPVRAEAYYPGQEEDSQEVPPVGGGMNVMAKGLDVRAEADSQDSPNPEAIDADEMRSLSVNTVRDGRAVATLETSIRNASLAGGIVRMDSVRTFLEVTSDAATAGTIGQTVVDGLVINGYGYTLDEEGLRPNQEGQVGDPVVPLPGGPPAGEEELRETMGIEILLARHEETLDGASATRRAGGVIVRIDAAKLKALLEPVPANEVVNEVVGTVEQVPLPPDANQVKGPVYAAIYQFLSLAPTIEYVLARGAVNGGASTPFEFDFELPPLDTSTTTAPGTTATTPFTGSTSSGSTGSFSGGSSSFSAPGFSSVGLPEAPAEQPPAEVAPPVAAGATTPLPALFGGLSPAMLLVGLGLAGLGARGLAGAMPWAMAGAGPLGGPCSLGAPRDTPDLRVNGSTTDG